MTPVKFENLPWARVPWAIPVGRRVTVYASAASTLVVIGVSSGRNGARERKSRR